MLLRFCAVCHNNAISLATNFGHQSFEYVNSCVAVNSLCFCLVFIITLSNEWHTSRRNGNNLFTTKLKYIYKIVNLRNPHDD